MKPYVPGHECFFSRTILPRFMEAVEKEHRISYDSLLMLAAVTCGPIRFINEALVYWRRHPQATSYQSSSHYSLLKGLVSAVQTLSNKDKRKITQRYFMALSDYPFTDYAAAKIIRCMKKGIYGAFCKAVCSAATTVNSFIPITTRCNHVSSHFHTIVFHSRLQPVHHLLKS